MAMKFRMISDADVKAIRTARKALNRIAKRAKRLNAADDAALKDQNVDWKPHALKNWRMLDELDALGIVETVGPKGKESLMIRLTPSGELGNGFAL